MRHAFICQSCQQPTREKVDVYCLECAERIRQEDEVEVNLVHLARESAGSFIGHPGIEAH